VRFRVLNMSIGLHLTRYTRILSVPSAVTDKWGPLHYFDDQSLNIPGLELKVTAYLYVWLFWFVWKGGFTLS
jgi:hypothetical protein